MAVKSDVGKLKDTQEDTTPADVGQDIDDEDDGMTPQTFGTFAHQAYEWAAEEEFDDVESNRSVVVTKPDGTEAQGYIETFINERIVIDYKSSYMPAWSVADARRYGNEHGQQVKEYVTSKSMPDDAQGWIIATVPPESMEVRDAYSEAVSRHGVGVKFSAGEQQDNVMQAVSEAVESTPPQSDPSKLDTVEE